MFRYDLKFDKLITYLEKQYRNFSKVKIIMHACSDGEEVYSFMSKLLNTLGEDKSKKYFPIIANDIDSTHINLAQQGMYKIEEFEERTINENLGNSFKDFFIKCGQSTVAVRDILKKLVKFNVSNILDDVKNKSLINTILFVRNMWAYLTTDEANVLAEYLSHCMDSSSTLIIGDYDRAYNIDNLLKKYGFYESTKVKNVFFKREVVPHYIPSRSFSKTIKNCISKIKAGL